MKRGFLIFVLVIAGLYLGLHLVLGSSPVQKRVLAEIRKALSEFGLDLRIESIEFSALSPKIYLNRVTVSATAKSPIPLPEPLAIDKIKIQFQPLALIYRKIVIEETLLFHPRIIVPNADRLYRKIEQVIKSKKKVEVSTGTFKLEVNKFGVVDALFNVVSKDPPIAVRSRGLTLIVQRNAGEQHTVTVQSDNLELERGAIKLNLAKTDVDVDLAKNSLRVNRGIVEGGDFRVNIKGATALPFREGKGPESFSASYDVQIPVPMLNQIPELKLLKMTGVVKSAGTIKLADGVYAGDGNVKYEGFSYDDYKAGSGTFDFRVSEKRVRLSDLRVQYGGGDVRAPDITINLEGRYPIAGDLTIRDLHLDGLLDHLNQKGAPLRMLSSGTGRLSGFLSGPFHLTGQIKQEISNFVILGKGEKSPKPGKNILAIPSGKVEGTLDFFEDKLAFQASIATLGGTLQTEGQVGYNNTAKLRAKGEGLSLTQMGSIGDVKFAGTTSLSAEVEVAGKEVKVAGSFDGSAFEIQDLVIGSVKGQAYYQSELLAFEGLETAALEPVRGAGFVDFKPEDIHYRFALDARRVNVDQIFGIFQKSPLKFSVPQGGELGSRIVIEGGHDTQGIMVTATGQARNFTFYRERWASAAYDIVYRPAFIELSRVMLLKKTGGLEVRGKFLERGGATLSLRSQGLKLEELDYIGNAPITGEVVGDVTLSGDLTAVPPRGDGEIKIIKMSFRGKPVPDSSVKMRSDGPQVEFVASVVGERLRGRYLRPINDRRGSDLLLYFRDFDFAPLSTMLYGRDVPPLNEITASGDISLKGDLSDWSAVRGTGTVTDLTLGLKGSSMKNQERLDVGIENGAITTSRFNLVGTESQISVEILYQPEKIFRASIDGKLDLQFLQPFIPGVEYGTGKVSAGIRISGKPENFEMLGNLSLENGVFRLSGLSDEVRAAQAQLSISQDRISIDKFDGVMNGGTVVVEGDVTINRFKSMIPALRISATKVLMRTGNYLTSTITGDFFIRGTEAPYLFGGKCRVQQANLTRFDIEPGPRTGGEGKPAFRYDVMCEARDKIFVTTDVMDAEFKGNFQLLGTSDQLGLLGNAEAIKGSVLFRYNRFDLSSGTVKFESPTSISPRFNIWGVTRKKEETGIQQEYEISLQVFGTPSDYKIRLLSSPPLPENEVIALLLLGVTGKTQDGNYVGFATALAGQSPIQSKLQSELGVDIRINTEQVNPGSQAASTGTGTTATSSESVPSIQIKKDITKKTKLSYSNSLDFGGTSTPIRELKIEQALDDNFSINGTTTNRVRGGTTQSTQSYGVDFRYRFTFE